MSKSWKRIGKNIGAYGAALAGLAGAQAAQGAVVNLSPSPTTNPYVKYGSEQTISLGSGLSFRQSNNHFGRTLNAVGAVSGVRIVSSGSTITTSAASFLVATYPGGTGTRTIAFRTSSHQVGWIRMNLGSAGSAITYLAAAYESTPGTSIIAGESAPTPEPGSAALFGLGLLALGAAGIRKMRRNAAAAS